MFTKMYKIYGRDGHRISESFHKSRDYEYSASEKMSQIRVINGNITRHHNFIYVIVTADSPSECEHNMWGQLSDGIFENMRFGKVVEIKKLKDFVHISELILRNISNGFEEFNS